MIKDVLREKHIKISELSRECEIPYSTMNDLINGKIQVEKCSAGLLKKLADALGKSMDEAYDLFPKEVPDFWCVMDNVYYEAGLIKKNKQYFMQFIKPVKKEFLVGPIYKNNENVMKFEASQQFDIGCINIKKEYKNLKESENIWQRTEPLETYKANLWNKCDFFGRAYTWNGDIRIKIEHDGKADDYYFLTLERFKKSSDEAKFATFENMCRRIQELSNE